MEEAREQFVFNWVASKIEAASAFIVICSPEYKKITDSQREEDDEYDDDDLELSEGVKRTRAEWRHIRSHAFTGGKNRCIPVFFDTIQRDWLPLDLSTADPLCWPEQEMWIVDRLCSLFDRDGEGNGQDVGGVIDA